MKRKNKNNNWKLEMSKTKCATCGKTIFLPKEAPTNYRDIHNTDVGSFILPERAYYVDDSYSKIYRHQLAHCDPLHGGYFCLDCYEKAKLEVLEELKN